MNSSNPTLAVIGDQALVKVFGAIGYDCFYETEPQAVIDRCEALAAAGCQIILILEKTAAQIGPYLDARAAQPYPIIMPIPDTVAHGNYGQARLQANMEKAMGIKIGGNL